ncbi:MAG: hypothetical protein MJZ76_04895 [Bacteroidales bacterium]|nr:hypothetical protein [Bacteroidales bacterium]
MKKTIFCLIFSALLVGSFTSCKKEEDEETQKAIVPTEQEIKSKIIGRWKFETCNGVALLTNEKVVQTFSNDGVCLLSATRRQWDAKQVFDYGVSGNTVTRTGRNVKYTIESTVKSISDKELVFSGFRFIQYADRDNHDLEKYVKVEDDFSQAIIGLWEGVSVEGDTTYGNAEHRWEYKADGTYTYYDKSGEEWVPSADAFNEYNMDGNWFASRWKDAENSPMNYEWWDVECCNETQMVWTALRAREDGTRFTTKFILKRVTE